MEPAELSAPPFAEDAAPPLLVPDVVPPGGIIYKVDSSRASFGELWRDIRSVAVLGAWISKLLRVRLPGSVNDPNVESLDPFEVTLSELPPAIVQKMQSGLREMQLLGFDTTQLVVHCIVDLFNNSRLNMLSVGRLDGRAIGRICVRTEGSRVPPKTHSYCELITELRDGRFTCTTSARARLDPPPGITVQGGVGATPSQLWATHQQALLALEKSPGIAGAIGLAAVRDLIDRHHVKLRDFHLRRRLFVPLSIAEQASAAAISEAYTSAQVGGFASPDVLAEMERLQMSSNNWLTGLIILGVSLAAFLAVGIPGAATESRESRSWEALAILVPVLLFHELGHYLAMRIFRYRNVKMFFIPFFGAAVSGQSYGAPGWKKVIVSLMGPLPGIVVGTGLGIGGMLLHHALMMKIALITLLLNGMNLLPVLPLDGGRIIQSILFCRHYGLDVAFRVIAGAVLILAGLGTHDKILLYLGIAMLVAIPAAIRSGKMVTELRREGFTPPPPGDDQKISPVIAQAIITRVAAGLPKALKKPGKTSNRVQAQRSLAVYELLCARPPGVWATIGFGTVQASGIVISALLALVLVIAQGGKLSSFARAAARQPKQSISDSEIAELDASAPAISPTTNPADRFARTDVIANFNSVADARTTFSSLGSRLNGDESLVRFGQSLIVSIPSSDDLSRHQWISYLSRTSNSVSADVSAAGGGFGGVHLTLTASAPTEADAQKIQDELNQYCETPRALCLLPPWESPTPQQQRARQTYFQLQRTGSNFDDPQVKSIQLKLETAMRQGDQLDIKRLQAEQQKTMEAIRLANIEKMRSSPENDPAVIDDYLRLPTVPFSGDIDDGDYHEPDYLTPTYQSLAAKMGQVAVANGKPVDGSDRDCTIFGNSTHELVLLRINWVGFVDAAKGAPALVHWLTSHGCRNMKYEFNMPGRQLDLPTGGN